VEFPAAKLSAILVTEYGKGTDEEIISIRGERHAASFEIEGE
jgi:hypothetical protein